ncbi:MAG TPA: DHHA1 domain-containing protein, partial [Bellilinea sp.]|nr:DHHA1 domain-containing protein [Bellilinea sp.]
PTIVGSRADGEIRASCRSIVELHITKTLDECADLLVRHGGHASAAGFTVVEDRWPELLERLNAIARRELAHKDLRPVIRIDADVALKDLKSELLDWIELLEPTGMENPLPVFCTRNVELRNVKVIGSEKNHLKFLAAQQNLVFDCVAFKMAELKSDLPKLVDIAYTFEKNNWQGRTSLQLKVIDIKPAASLQSGI